MILDENVIITTSYIHFVENNCIEQYNSFHAPKTFIIFEQEHNNIRVCLSTIFLPLTLLSKHHLTAYYISH